MKNHGKMNTGLSLNGALFASEGSTVGATVGTGKAFFPMTGEANNGFLRVWKSSGVKSVAPIFTPGLGAATVRAAA